MTHLQIGVVVIVTTGLAILVAAAVASVIALDAVRNGLAVIVRLVRRLT